VPAGGPEQQMLQLINQQRLAQKLPPLKMHPALTKLAREYVVHMAREGKLQDDLDGKTFPQRLEATQYKHNGAVPLIGSEPNGKADEVVALWIKTEATKKFLLGNYADCGIGIAPSDKGGVYFYLVLAAPAG